MQNTSLQHENTLFRTFPYSIKIANTFFSRFKGLMFRMRPLDQEALWIHPCNSIHMCFMHFPIDVIFLDKHNKVVKLCRQLKPWRFIPPIKGAISVLELPSGTIEAFQIKEGQVIFSPEIEEVSTRFKKPKRKS